MLSDTTRKSQQIDSDASVDGGLAADSSAGYYCQGGENRIRRTSSQVSQVLLSNRLFVYWIGWK